MQGALPMTHTWHHLVSLLCQIVQVVAHTKEGQYVLTRPATSYKKVFTPLAEKAAIVFEASNKYCAFQLVMFWLDEKGHKKVFTLLAEKATIVFEASRLVQSAAVADVSICRGLQEGVHAPRWLRGPPFCLRQV